MGGGTGRRRGALGKVADRIVTSSKATVSSRNGTHEATVNSHAPTGWAIRLRDRDDAACNRPLARGRPAGSTRTGRIAVVAFS
jgi:hypothetical protein